MSVYELSWIRAYSFCIKLIIVAFRFRVFRGYVLGMTIVRLQIDISESANPTGRKFSGYTRTLEKKITLHFNSYLFVDTFVTHIYHNIIIFAPNFEFFDRFKKYLKYKVQRNIYLNWNKEWFKTFLIINNSVVRKQQQIWHVFKYNHKKNNSYCYYERELAFNYTNNCDISH